MRARERREGTRVKTVGEEWASASTVKKSVIVRSAVDLVSVNMGSVSIIVSSAVELVYANTVSEGQFVRTVGVGHYVSMAGKGGGVRAVALLAVLRIVNMAS